MVSIKGTLIINTLKNLSIFFLFEGKFVYILLKLNNNSLISYEKDMSILVLSTWPKKK